MSMGVYQERAADFMISSKTPDAPGHAGTVNKLVVAAGLAEETGEVMKLVKKSVRTNSPMRLDLLREELGDALWQLAQLATLYGLRLEDIAAANIEKLEARHGE